jgi:hypothetical protein
MEHKKKKDKENPIQKITLTLAIAVVIVMLFNVAQLSALKQTSTAGMMTGMATNSVIPTGIPAVYGEKLGIAYDHVSATNPQLADATIRKMAMIDQSTVLEGAQLDRYIDILYNMENGMSCEYCCGARSIIFENGQAACGCAHSFAMRGLTKHLIQNSQLSNEQILEEIGKWKTLFFPSQMTQKAAILEQNGIEFNYINLASNKYRGIEQGKTGSGMVGGC